MSIIAAIIGIIIAIGGYFFYDNYAASLPTDSVRTEENSKTPDVPMAGTVDRSGQNLRTISKDDILAMGTVQQLVLSNNQLTGALPAEIRFLSNLEVLDISNNRMTGLPAEIGQLSKLRVLNAAHNQLTGIPHELGNLRNLEILDLSGNDISEQDLEVIRSRLPASTKIVR